MFSLKGVHVPHRKHTDGMKAVTMPPPVSVTIPTSMHIGAPATISVKAGDHVDVGTLIASQSGFVSSSIYSSVSGTVKGIEEILISSGRRIPAVTILSDGAMTEDPDLLPPVISDRQSLVNAIRDSGIVGLGGAGFPTYVKFSGAAAEHVEYLLINGAECEPYITSDSVVMTDRSEDIAYALKVMLAYMDIQNVIIGIEMNKPRAIASMQAVAKMDSRIQVKVLPSVYPQGGEKVLVYHCTGRQIPLGKLPIDVGCIVCNSTTIASIGKYLQTGMPLVKKCVTVDGSAVKEPKNVICPIGTSLKDVFDFCGGFREDPAKVLYGGPMMGIAVPDLKVPILKNTNAILALNSQEGILPPTTACIRCGSCLNHCPFGINPTRIVDAYDAKDTAAMKKAGAELCMECGSCTFICPAKRPLVSTIRMAKAMLRAEAMKGGK